MTPLGILLVALAIVIGGILAFRLHPFVTLIVAAFAVAILTPAGGTITGPAGQRVAEGFGKTALDVGIVIAMASILGTCLSVAGGAQRIVLSIRTLVGERHTPLALLLAGFILGIPMFAETVFYLLLPLARAAWKQTGRHYLLNVLAIVAGATMTHSLVPPTPGPLFVADAFDVDLATMIGCGLVVGLVAALAGFVYARWADGRWPMDPQPVDGPDAASGREGMRADETARMPPLWAALLPILLPVILISLDSMTTAQSPLIPAERMPWVVPLIRFWGEKNIALSLAAVVSILILAATAWFTLVRAIVARARRSTTVDPLLVLWRRLLAEEGFAGGHDLTPIEIARSLDGSRHEDPRELEDLARAVERLLFADRSPTPDELAAFTDAVETRVERLRRSKVLPRRSRVMRHVSATTALRLAGLRTPARR